MKDTYDSSDIGPAQASVFRSNEQIKEEVQELIADNDAIHPKRIGVSVDEGVVTLKGRVDDRESALEAEAAARAVLGVVAVQNELEIGA